MMTDPTRHPLIDARQSFFAAVAENLTSDSRRADADLDSLGNYEGKFPAPADIAHDAERCWLVVRPTDHRPFKISVWQPGDHLRIGVQLPPQMVTRKASISNQLDPLFGANKPHMRMRDEHYFYDWHFDLVDLSLVAQREKYVFYIQGLLETALHVTT